MKFKDRDTTTNIPRTVSPRLALPVRFRPLEVEEIIKRDFFPPIRSDFGMWVNGDGFIFMKEQEPVGSSDSRIARSLRGTTILREGRSGKCLRSGY